MQVGGGSIQFLANNEPLEFVPLVDLLKAHPPTLGGYDSGLELALLWRGRLMPVSEVGDGG